MVALTPDRLVVALRALDLDERALLTLSLHHGLPDEEIVAILGLERRAVAGRRFEAMTRLTEALATNGPLDDTQVRGALAGLSPEDWQAATTGAGPTPAEAEPRAAGGREAGPAAVEVPPDEGRPRPSGRTPSADAATARAELEEWVRRVEAARSRSAPRPGVRGRSRRRRARAAALLVPVAVAAAAAAGAAALVPLLDGTQDGDRPSADRGAPSSPSAPIGRPVALRAVSPSGSGQGTARLVGTRPDARIELSVRGLAGGDASYEVWLFNSVADAVSLGRFERGGAKLELDPRGRLGDFRFLDVSRQPPGAGRSHSGESLLRVPTARLRPGS